VIVGKELRLKQQYFWTAASLADMMRRFKNLDKPISEFAECMPFIRAQRELVSLMIAHA
jgi:glucan phosphorylase